MIFIRPCALILLTKLGYNRIMRKTVIILALVFTTITALLTAQQPGVVTGKAAIDKSLVELFAKTMELAQAKATAATTALSNPENSPEQASSTADALKAIAATLGHGSNILGAEEKACAETGMKFAEFQEVRTRLLQVKLLASLESNQALLKGNVSGNAMNEESLANLDKKLAALEENLKKSQAELEKAIGAEAEYFAKQDEKIAKQKQSISKVTGDIARAKTEKQRQSKEKQLKNAEEKLAKMEIERQKPYRALESAREKVLKNEQKVSQFKEALPAAKEQLTKIGTDIQQYQDKVDAGIEQTRNSDIMQQAALDRPVFEQFPNLQIFMLQPKQQ